MKSTIKFAAIIAVLAGFLMVASPASAHRYRHHRHHHRSVVYVTTGIGYGGYYGYARPYYYRPYYAYPYGYYPRPYYYGRPAISIGFGF